LLLSAGSMAVAATDGYLLPARRSAANPPVLLSIDKPDVHIAFRIALSPD